MRTRWLLVMALLGACGKDSGTSDDDDADVDVTDDTDDTDADTDDTDADTDDTDDTDDTPIDAAPAAPTVMVTAPKLGRSFYPTDTIPTVWRVSDTDSSSVLCDVDAVSATATISVATDVMVTPGVMGRVMWDPSAAAVGDYTMHVTCTDATALAATGMSAEFPMGPPATVTVAEVKLVFARCDGGQCHDASGPANGLNLTDAAMHGELVNVASEDCPDVQRVQPNDPNASYLMHKLYGEALCFDGVKMPRGYTLTPAQIKQVRDWIAIGAPNN
jgi:hypothetical protein